MNRNILALLGAVVGLSACLNTSEPGGPEQNYGFVFLETFSQEGDFVTNPNAVFYRTRQLQLPSTNGTSDMCLVGLYSDDQTGGQLPASVSAGQSIQVALSGDTRSLAPVTTGEGTRYIVTNGTSLAFNPGDTATVTIPGAEEGFPEWTMKAKTAEAFTPQAVPSPANPEAIPLRWSPAASTPGSKMLVSMRYPSDNGDAMLQVYCELNDDGAHDVDPSTSQGWRLADPSEKDVLWSRWRITGQGKPGAALLVISTFQVPFDVPTLQP